MKKCEKTYQQTVSHIHICRNVMCFHLFPGLGSAITAWNARIFLLQRSATWCSRAHMMRFRPNTTSAEACNPKQITTTNSFSFSMVHGSNVILICITCYPLFSDIHIIYCIILYYIMLCYIVFYHITLYYIILYCIILYIILYYVILYYVMLYDIILLYIITITCYPLFWST